jgi:imidazolonepropionase-like amidohydrolase
MSRVVYSGGVVFDGVEGFRRADVAVVDGRIGEVGAGLEGDVVVDIAGRFMVPGLIDCHVHLNRWTPGLMERSMLPFSYQFYAGARSLALTLASGVTTVRDASGADLGMKRALDDGLLIGPDVVLAINSIGTTGGHTDPWKLSGAPIYHWMPHPGRPHVLADGPEEMRKVARLLFRAGADWLKVCTSGGINSSEDSPHHSYLHASEVEALVDEATIRGAWVMAHADGLEGIRSAVLGGVRSIEHGTFLDEEVAEMMAQRGVWLVPTLSVINTLIADYEAGTGTITERSYAKALEAKDAGTNAVRLAAKAGVRMALGTDAGVGAHGEALAELEWLSEAGLSAEDIWRASTSSGAELLGLEHDRGLIRAGHRADLAVFSGDPQNLTDLKSRLSNVIHNGEDMRPRLEAIMP